MNESGQSSARGAEGPGRRGRNKERKLRAIERAGRELFEQRGFEETTTRAIAQRAGIASGTFFLYFQEKRDLLLHLVQNDVTAVQEEAFASLDRTLPLVDQLTWVLGRFYAHYGKNPRLSRVVIKEILFVEPGERGHMVKLTLDFVTRLAELVAAAREAREIDPKVDPLQVAAHVFALYDMGLVAWLNSVVPSRELACAQLERQLELLVSGIGKRAP